MKFLINSTSESAGAKVCVKDLTPLLLNIGHEVKLNDWNYESQFDVVLFMSERTEVKKARKKIPNALIGIMDSKIAKQNIKENKSADFLIVSSIEQKDALLEENPNVFIYYMFPYTEEKPKVHKKKEKTIIGYHGNKLHLHAFYPIISKALDNLSQNHRIELWAIYNIKSLGKWTKGLPQKTPVKHIQWEENTLSEYLHQCDIGLVNNLKPVFRPWPQIRISNHIMNIISKGYGKDYSDLLLRYKYNTNPGRIYVFSQLHIPVVSDFALSASQFIRHEDSGLLANTQKGWEKAIETLILSAEKRSLYSENLKKYIQENASIEQNFNKLMQFINNLINNRKNAQLNQ